MSCMSCNERIIALRAPPTITVNGTTKRRRQHGTVLERKGGVFPLYYCMVGLFVRAFQINYEENQRFFKPEVSSQTVRRVRFTIPKLRGRGSNKEATDGNCVIIMGTSQATPELRPGDGRKGWQRYCTEKVCMPEHSGKN